MSEKFQAVLSSDDPGSAGVVVVLGHHDVDAGDEVVVRLRSDPDGHDPGGEVRALATSVRCCQVAGARGVTSREILDAGFDDLTDMCDFLREGGDVVDAETSVTVLRWEVPEDVFDEEDVVVEDDDFEGYALEDDEDPCWGGDDDDDE